MPQPIRRIVSLTLSLIVASAVIFAVVDLVPGDPASFMLGTGARPDTVAALREQMGLNLPWPVRYAHWLGGVLHGDLGTSLAYKTPVAGMIWDRVQVSLPLALMALAIAAAVAFPVGMLAARRRDPQAHARDDKRAEDGGGAGKATTAAAVVVADHLPDVRRALREDRVLARRVMGELLRERELEKVNELYLQKEAEVRKAITRFQPHGSDDFLSRSSNSASEPCSTRNARCNPALRLPPSCLPAM